MISAASRLQLQHSIICHLLYSDRLFISLPFPDTECWKGGNYDARCLQDSLVKSQKDTQSVSPRPSHSFPQISNLPRSHQSATDITTTMAEGLIRVTCFSLNWKTDHVSGWGQNVWPKRDRRRNSQEI